MSDKDRLSLRKQPLVPAVTLPDRFSQTLLAKADNCMRSAYLYVVHGGGVPGVQLDRGTAAHAVFERMTTTLLEREEPSFVGMVERQLLEEGLDAKQAGLGSVAALTAEIVDEVLRERPDLPLPVGDADAVREMAYHWAIGMAIDPAKIVGVERKFVMDIAGREVSGIVDLAAIAGDVAQVDDYKSSFSVPDQEKYERGFQGKLYGGLLLFGHPVERVRCGDCNGVGVGDLLVGPGVEPARAAIACDSCGGRGYVERREPCIGGGVGYVRTRELYPRYLNDDGTLRSRENVLSRAEVQDFLVDVERLVLRLEGAGKSLAFPARPGSHCSQCPARPECPLPAHLRSHAGEINSMGQASEAAAKADTMRNELDALEKELKGFANAHGPIRYGVDLVRRFKASEGRSVKRVAGRAGWDELQQAAVNAAEFGEPFDIGEWVKPTRSMRFVREALTAEELEAEIASKEESNG